MAEPEEQSPDQPDNLLDAMLRRSGRPNLEKQRIAMRRAYAEGFANADSSVDVDRHLAVLRYHQEKSDDDDDLRIPLKPHTCRYCQEFVVDPSGTAIKPNEFFIGPKKVAFPGIQLAHVKEGASNDCVLCQSMLDKIDRSPEPLKDEDYESMVGHLELWPKSGEEYDVEIVEQFHLRDPNRPWICAGKGWSDEKWTYACLAEHDDPAAAFVTARPINLAPSSEESWKLIRSWRAECIHGHESCQPFQTRYRPSRLIEIAGEGEATTLRLVETDSQPLVDYTTLSYCWGGPQHAQTTTTNLPQRKLSLPLTSLPATLRDAILVTRHLRISHIWIDSLCILQDSPADKATQIAAMPRIYQNAALTISTSRATHANAGFLAARKPTDHPSSSLRLPFRLPSTGQSDGRVTLFRPTAELAHDNLSDRAWPLQEFALSPRVLDFAAGQTRWMCACHWFVDGWRRHEGFVQKWNLRRRFVQMMRNNVAGVRTGTFALEEGCALWEELVGEYTGLLLSVQSDRALAVAGLAEVCEGHFGSRAQYVAGLWKTMFPWGLMWAMADQPGGRLRRPAVYQGPSWSWMGVNGAVQFGFGEKLFGGAFVWQVIDCSTELEYEEAPFGAVKSGALVVEGKTLRAKWLRTEAVATASGRPWSQDRLVLQDPAEGSDGVVGIKMRPDAEEPEWDDHARDSMDVVLLEVAYEPAEQWHNHGVIGFVLRELEDGFYSRLGIFEIFNGPALREEDCSEEQRDRLWKQFRHIFEKCEPEVLIIV